MDNSSKALLHPFAVRENSEGLKKVDTLYIMRYRESILSTVPASC